MYLMLCTRPDMVFVVGALSQYCSLLRTSHLNAPKHLLRYIKTTAHLGLGLGPFASQDFHPELYFDADWAGDLYTRKSTCGYLCLLTKETPQGEPIQSAVSWSSRRQHTVALSGTEAEYMALTQAAKEAIWVSRFLAEMHNISLDTDGTPAELAPKVRINGDNQSSIALARNPGFHARTKHIAILEHNFTDKSASGEIQPEYLHIADMIAGCLTKNLSREKVERFRSTMGLQ